LIGGLTHVANEKEGYLQYASDLIAFKRVHVLLAGHSIYRIYIFIPLKLGSVNGCENIMVLIRHWKKSQHASIFYIAFTRK
jgi:hypothetical protein